jgi:hypothetical protein
MKLQMIPWATIIAMAQFDLKNAIIRLVDGTGSPNKLQIKVGEGTLTFDETKAREYIRDRGRLSTVRNGDQDPMDVSFDLIWEFLKGATTTIITPEDFLKQRGGASAYISSDTDVCAPYAVDIEIWYDPTCSTDKIETITLPDFRYEKLSHDAKAGMIKCSGKCNATEATVVRTAQT